MKWIVIFSVPACLCTGPRWPDPSLPLWKAWTETSSGAKLSSYCTLLEFICSVYTLCMEYGWSSVCFHVVIGLSVPLTVRQQENSWLCWSWRQNSLFRRALSRIRWPSLTTGEMAKQVILRLDRPITRTKPYSTVVGNKTEGRFARRSLVYSSSTHPLGQH